MGNKAGKLEKSDIASSSRDSWQDLSEAALAVARQGDTREALAMLQNGMDVARRGDDRAGEIAMLNGAAVVHSIRGDYWASMAGSIDAFFLARTAGDRLGMAAAMTMLAGSLLLMTPIDSEIGILRAALRMSEEEQDARLQTRIHNLLGIVLGDLGRFGESELHLDMAAVLAQNQAPGFDKWRVLANAANLLRKRAQAARQQGDFHGCAQYCAQGLERIGRVEAHCRETGKTPVLLDAISITALLHLQNADHQAACAKFESAWKLAVETRTRSVLPFLGMEIAKLDLLADQLESAEATLSQALGEAAFYRPSPKAAGLCELMAVVQRRRGDERGEAHWQAEARKARAAFDALKTEARAQMARVIASLAPEVAA